MKPTIALVIPLGPGDKDIERTRDILDAVRTYEPLVTDVILLDDSGTDRKVATLLDPIPGTRIVSLPAERNRSHSALRGGHCFGILQLLAHAYRHTSAQYVLRFDTDAHIVAPFAYRVHNEYLKAGPKAGLLGCCTMGPDGEQRPLLPWNHVMTYLSKPFTIWATSPRFGNVSSYFNFALAGPRKIIRTRILQAIANGYKPGQTPMGGAYMVSRPLLAAFDKMGILDEGHAWSPTQVAEDAMMAVYVYAAGFELADSYRPGTLASPGDVFAILWKQIHDHPRRIIDQGYAIIHSVKRYNFMTESDIRQELAACRHEYRAANAPLQPVAAS